MYSNALMAKRGKKLNKTSSNHWAKQRDNILSAAMKLFWQKGYDGTSIQEIADASRVNKATIYYYFESKPTILYEITSKILNTLTDMAQAVMNSGLSPDKKLERLIFNQVMWSFAHPRNLGAFLLERRNLPPKLLQIIISKRDYYEGMFRELLNELIPKNQSQYPSPKIATFFTFGVMLSLANWYKEDGELSPEEIASKVYMFISEALGIPKST